MSLGIVDLRPGAVFEFKDAFSINEFQDAVALAVKP